MKKITALLLAGLLSLSAYAGVNNPPPTPLLSTSDQTVTDSTTTSGNVNADNTTFTVSNSSTSTAVYAGKVGQCYSTGSTINGGGHTICVFGYNHVQATQDLAIGTEGKLIMDGSGKTLTSGASVHCGLADILSGNTMTNWTGCNSVITENHGTLSNAKGFDFGVTAASTAIGNLFAYNAQDVAIAKATNYGAFRGQVTAGTAHFNLYLDGTAQNGIMGNTYIGATTDNGLAAKLQVTGTASFSSSIYQAKMTASASAPGATVCKEEFVCGTNAGTAKKIVYCGTSATAVTITDNIGTGVSGC